jgi:integrase
MAIRKRGARYQIRIRLGSGQRLEKTLPSGATRRDAVDAEATLRRAAIDDAAGRKPRALIDAALDKWVAEGASQLRSYEKDLRYRVAVLREHTKGRYLDELGDVAASVKRTGLTLNLKAASINRYLSILKRIGNLAAKWKWVEHPLGHQIEKLPGEEERHVYLTKEEVTKLCKHADWRLIDLIRFLALTGLRRGEALGLTPESVRDGYVRLTARTKSGRPRAIPLTREAAAIAKRRLPWELSVPNINRLFNEARVAAGMRHVRAHDLRHTFASWILQSGGSLTAVRDLLGHSSLAVTSKYAHLASEHLQQAVSNLPRLGSNSGQHRRSSK